MHASFGVEVSGSGGGGGGACGLAFASFFSLN